MGWAVVGCDWLFILGWRAECTESVHSELLIVHSDYTGLRLDDLTDSCLCLFILSTRLLFVSVNDKNMHMTCI